MQDEPAQNTTGKINAKDIATGVFLIAIAGIGSFLNLENVIGTAAQMGPGYMPMLIFSLLAILGVAVIVVGLRNGPDPLERWAWKELVLILGAMSAFGVLIERIGLGLSVATVVVIASIADRSHTVLGVAGMTVALVFICWLVFIIGLNLNVSFLPPALTEL
ncbi:tripartite tricarboxylate transporter TctB family protein [Rhizobium sp. Leaf386]|uniref:tripartite tricarboxylate transporter TctB family protein n=1 Tax=Rhizobium sp. Leaf386 TaxID=1736359 RepID=UPI0007154D3B|nr:tripartite tricarboxylate transporter TctB family protein [Rhizobium sp. Leaf386]KQS95493.1 hypothetical protein ASG50_24605 [Rhizobium sp. Leaf386]